MLSVDRAPTWRPQRTRLHPGQMIVYGFAAAALAGTALLSLPAATETGQRATFADALFTATSAVCVTGLVTVDTGTHWSLFGELVILLLIQLGGLGIMTVATLVTVLISGRLGLRSRLLAQAETKALGLSGVRRLVRNIVLFSLATELLVAIVLSLRFAVGHDEPVGQAVYDGIFHAVSAFNNAGFSTHADSLMSYTTDGWICLTIAVAVIVGGIGYPVVFELARNWRTLRSWSVLTRVTVTVTVTLLVASTLVFLATEANNPKTLGPLDSAGKLLGAFFTAVMARTAGFNSIDIGSMRSEGLLATDILMFIGGGSAGTAGGIKVTTFGLLAFVLWSEMRGEKHVVVGRRQVPATNQRQALAVALLGIGAVVAGTFLMLGLTDSRLDQALFEVISAFGTVGLTTGITGSLPQTAESLLVLLMFIGRVGPLTLASALALRDRARRYEFPEERTIVG